MSELKITCPSCGAEVPLTESLAAPIVAATRREYEERLAAKDIAVAKREKAIQEQEEALRKAQESVDDRVAEQMKRERARIAEEEQKRARLALATDLEQRSRELADLKGILANKDAKLAEAQKTQAEFMRKERELDEARKELELNIEKGVRAGLDAAQDRARKEAEEQLKLKVLEKEQTIASMQKQIEDLRRKAEQGSQQLQGEVQELELENLLRAGFPQDTITPVPKGEFGGDVTQTVVGPIGMVCGTILWESKRTKNWSEGWLAKLRDDQHAAKAEAAVLVSQALPKGTEVFSFIDGIWVTQPAAALPIAMLLRHTLVEVALARKSAEGRQDKMEILYEYLTGPRFRQRVEAIVESFSSMQEDLLKEKKAIMKQWAKREEQIARVMTSTVGMYGDLQGIAGASIQEIKGLELPAPEEEAD